MAFPDELFSVPDTCEICGAELGTEIVIQEFADGTLVRLCPVCAAQATFGHKTESYLSRDPEAKDDSAVFPPLEDTMVDPLAGGEHDPLEMTKELLTPLTDLILLQGEMQAALERLAGSLERFATEVITDSMGKTATVENRLRTLEGELERTRNRLREAESLLVAADAPAPAPARTPVSTAAPEPAAAEPTPQAAAPATPEVVVQPVKPNATPPPAFVPTPPTPAPAPPEPVSTEMDEPAGADETDMSEWTLLARPRGDWEPDSPTTPATEPATTQPGDAFSLQEVRLAQRCFNEGAFTERMRDVRRSLGRPQANLSRIAGPEPRVLVTIFWDIVWYQYLVDLRHDIPAGERVSLFREGMELEELGESFRIKNSTIDEAGRLDASELEVRLISDPALLITEMTPDDEQALEDATEEIWDQHAAPEFRWDD